MTSSTLLPDTEFAHLTSKFTYNPELSVAENVVNLGNAHSLRRGLRYEIPSDIAYQVVTVGGVKMRSLKEAVSGELIIKQMLSRHDAIKSEEQRAFLSQVASDIFVTNPEVFEDYTDAHSQLLRGRLSDKAMRDPAVVVKANEVSRLCTRWATVVDEESAIMNDLLVCYFLTNRAIQDVSFGFEAPSSATYVNIYSLAQSDYNALIEFMAVELGFKDKEEEDKDKPAPDEKVLEADLPKEKK